MPSSFRFEPPTPRTDLLTRPRLLRALLNRWDHRVVALVGGPGLGKTTLLGQAVTENLLAPRGEDVWIGLEARDGAGESLARAVSAAVGGDRGSGDAPAIADAVWRRSPTEVCLIFDDVHLLPPSSDGSVWLAELVEQLPTNGHVVLAGRADPPLPLARLRTQGRAQLIGEQELRFSGDELANFAARRGLDLDRFQDTGGWPAMAELTASVERHLAGSYVWEEVLDPLGPERRRVLATLCDLGGADDDLATAALGAPVDLAKALDGVPLVAVGDDGWRVPHLLWRTVPGIELAEADRSDIRRGAVQHLVERRRFDEAYGLVAETELWELAPAVLRAACVASDRPTSGQLERWLSVSPEAVQATPAGQLASAMRSTFTAPQDAIEPLQTAVESCRAAGDVDGELAALAELGRVAWWRQNLAVVGPVAARVAELAQTGHPLARGLAAIGRAVAADLSGDDDGVLEALDSIEPGVLDPGWAASAAWFRARILLSTGAAQAALDILDAIDTGADPVMHAILENLRLGAWSALGRVDDAIAGLPQAVELQSTAGVSHNRRLALVSAIGAFAHVGEVGVARRYVDEVGSVGESWADDLGVAGALAAASLLVAENLEDEAATMIRKAVERHGLERGIDRRAWRGALPLSYVLVPETRAHWDAAPLRGDLATARTLAAAVVAARSIRPGRESEQFRTIDVPDAPVVRAMLHYRFAAELAVVLAAAGRADGPALLEALGPVGREAVRGVADADQNRAKPARSLLAAVPAPPEEPSYLAVLGPLELRRDGPAGPEVTDSDLRRERVRTLLAYLVGHRATTRAEITAALWPDLDERSAANNLRVTLTYLLRVLEPWRPTGEPGYLVRLDGSRVELVTGRELRVDVDLFDEHIEAAARAEADGIPSVALEHNLAAAGLYRGHLHADLPDADWIDLDREHYRSRFVAAAVRSGQLLLGRGDTDQAEAAARRALEVDHWAEDAYGVLTAAALARGDRSAAQRQLDRGVAALAELGVEPSDATRQLRRRIRN